MEPSPPGRWAHSLCLYISLVFWAPAHHGASYVRLLALAGLLVVSPRLLIFTTGEPRTLLTPLEAFLAFQFGILLSGVSIGVLVNVRELLPLHLPSLTCSKSPSGALYTVRTPDDLGQRQFSHPLLTPITGASLLMSFSAYHAAEVGMLSTVFSTITGTVGLWGLWTVRPITPSYVAASDGGPIRLSSVALVGARNLEQTNAPPPSYLGTNPRHQRSRKVRERSSPNRAHCNSSADSYLVLPGER